MKTAVRAFTALLDKSTVRASKSLTYNIVSLTKSSKSLGWSLSTSTGHNVAISYAVGSIAAAQTTLVYFVYDDIVSPRLVLAYGVNQPAQQSKIFEYDINATAKNTRNVCYHIAGLLDRGTVLPYHVAGLSGADTGLVYDVFARRTATLGLKYSLRTPLARSAWIAYNMGSLAGKSAALKYDLYQQILDSLTVAYRVAVITARTSLNLLYNVFSIYMPASDVCWMGDSLPAGAVWVDENGKGVSSHRLTGSTSLQIAATDGYVEPGFTGALSGIPGGYVIIWLYVDPDAVPDCIWVTFHDGISWEHRAFWGKTLWMDGVLGRASKRRAAEIPTPGLWTPLVIHTDVVEIDNIVGAKFGVYKGQGTGRIYVDSMYYTDQPVMTIETPHVGLRDFDAYEIARDGTVIARTMDLSYNDFTAKDVWGYSLAGLPPVYNFKFDPSTEALTISWGIPSGIGTSYTYQLASYDSRGQRSSSVQTMSQVRDTYLRTRITISSPHTQQFAIEITGDRYIQYGPIRGETYHYVFETYNQSGAKISQVEKDYTIPTGSYLKNFVLGHSTLA